VVSGTAQKIQICHPVMLPKCAAQTQGTPPGSRPEFGARRANAIGIELRSSLYPIVHQHVSPQVRVRAAR
jgi:hypothetical protein